MTYLLHPKTFSGRTYELKEKLVQKVLEMDSTCADAWMLLHEMGKQPYDRRDRPQESLVAILRYVDLRPDDLIAWETLFAVKRAMKDDEKAIMGENLPPLEADLHRHATQRPELNQQPIRRWTRIFTAMPPSALNSITNLSAVGSGSSPPCHPAP